MNRNVIIVKALKMDMKEFRDWTLPRFVHGQGEKEKKTGRWIQDSIRIIRVRANIPSDEAEKLLLHMGHIFLWFLANATRKTFALINDRFEIIALHGSGLGRTRILDEIAKLRSKYFNE